MRRLILGLLAGVFLASCETEEFGYSGISEGRSQAVFRLCVQDYDGVATRQAGMSDGGFDRVEFYIVDRSGRPLTDVKAIYSEASSAVMAEGLPEGDYTLLVLSIRGDASHDEAVIHTLEHESDVWLTFPAHLQRPLQAEYFYSRTPFSVETLDGGQSMVSLERTVEQRRIMGRADFSFLYENPYVRTAVTSSVARLSRTRFYTSFSGDSVFSGVSDGVMPELDLSVSPSYYFMPTVDGAGLQGEIQLQTRRYTGDRVQTCYDFGQVKVEPNRIGRIQTQVEHPDNASGLLFVTRMAYEEGRHSRILQDDEPDVVYFNAEERSFNTKQPLQIRLTDDARLHLRFYSPRDLGHVLLQARIPSVHSEYIDLAYFDTIPAFADIYLDLPFTRRTAVFHTASGKNVEVPQVVAAELGAAEFRVSSPDDYWQKLQNIKHGWTLRYSSFNGDPNADDGGPAGNWMGIRPVHCREAVAFFLNFTYMIDLKEHEDILRANEHLLYGNGGPEDKVTADQVLEQMRQERTLQVGLVYPGNGVIGLGSPGVFGAYQAAYLSHYTSTYNCEIMFHELGHVMGYSHNSSFTYGPWAQSLMNHFYVDNLHLFPIDSPDYLKSAGNPNLYK